MENDNNIKIICTLFSFPFTAILMFYLSSYINIYFFKSMVICFVIDLLIYKLIYDILEKSIITINRNVLIVLNIIFNFLIIMTLLFNFYVLCSLYEKKLISIGIIIIGLIYDIYLNMYFIDPILTIKSIKEYILILENNIYGLEIDDRAYQFAYFAIMMKARYYNRNIFKMNIMPNIHSFTESNYLNEEFIFSLVNEKPELKEELLYIKNLFIDSKIYGSFIKPKKLNLKKKEKLKKVEAF